MIVQLAPVRTEVIQFRYKGERDYVQGPDLFNAIVGIHSAADISNIHLTIHGFVRATQCEAFIAGSRESLTNVENVRVRANFNLAGRTSWVVLREISTTEPAKRDEFSEERVTALCQIEDRRIVLRGDSPVTFIETAVAMNKFMHQSLFAQSAGRWVFAGIDLIRGCDARSGICLRIGGDANPRLTRAVIEHDGRDIGNLFFTLMHK